jgi:hypothetical protein
MQGITSTNKLKEAIQELQRKQLIEGELLKEQFALTVERIRPALVLKNFGENIVSAGIAGNLVNATVGLTAGYVSKRIFIGSSGNRFRVLLGNVLQLGMIGLITRNPTLVKGLTNKLMKRFMKKKNIA